jgi:hypothetical protein
MLITLLLLVVEAVGKHIVAVVVAEEVCVLLLGFNYLLQPITQ